MEGGIHPNLPIPIDNHEAKSGIYRFPHNCEIDSVYFGDRFPIVDSSAAKKIYS